jgi:predicted Zn-dependent peptidase
MDMLLDSKFAAADIQKEREVIKEEMAMYLDEPQHHVQELLNATMWPDQPLGRPITGSNKSLDAIGRKQLVGYLRGNYSAGNALVVIAGKIVHSRAVRAVKRYFRKFPSGVRSEFAQARSRQLASKIHLFTKSTEQTQIALGIRTCSRHDERRHALRLLNTILGENMSSRLFQVIREDGGLAYSIYSTVSFFADTGDIVVSAGLDTEQVSKTLGLITTELRRLKKSLVGAAELRRARDYVLGQLELGSESTEYQMNWVGEQLLGYGRIFKPAEIKRRLQQVSAADMRRVARDFFRPERLNLALVSPLKTAPLEKHVQL